MRDLKCNIFIEKNNLDLFKINISNLSNFNLHFLMANANL